MKKLTLYQTVVVEYKRGRWSEEWVEYEGFDLKKAKSICFSENEARYAYYGKKSPFRAEVRAYELTPIDDEEQINDEIINDAICDGCCDIVYNNDDLFDNEKEEDE